MADRYAYLPSVGILYLMAEGFVLVNEKYFNKNMIYLVFVLFGLSYFFTTYKQIKIWHDDITFWTVVIDKNQNIPIAYNNRGVAKNLQEDFSGAITDFDMAINLAPEKEEAYYGRGIAMSGLNDYQRAILDFNKAIELFPEYAEAYFNRGNAMAFQKKFPEAISDYSKAILIDTGYTQAYYNRGNAKTELKLYDDAIADFTKNIQLAGDYADAYYNRGIVRILKGEVPATCPDLVKAGDLGNQNASQVIQQYCR